MTYHIKCSCGKYKADFDNEGIAKSAAEMHILLGAHHVVSCIEKENGRVRVVFTIRGSK